MRRPLRLTNRNVPVTAEAMERNRGGRQSEQIVCDVHRGPRFNDDGDAADGPVATRRLPPHLVNPAH